MAAARRLKLARVAAGLTQLDVFRHTGIHPGRLSLLERGLVPLRETDVAALAAVLGCEPSELESRVGPVRWSASAPCAAAGV